MNDPTNMGFADFTPVRVWKIDQIVELQDSARRVQSAFANYLDGTGRDARVIATELIAILDDLVQRLPKDDDTPLDDAPIDETDLQQITDAFDAYARKRAADLLRFNSQSAHVNRMLEIACCLGYKAGVIDGAAVTRGK